MNKLLTTLALTFALLFGGPVALASADPNAATDPAPTLPMCGDLNPNGGLDAEVNGQCLLDEGAAPMPIACPVSIDPGAIHADQSVLLRASDARAARAQHLADRRAATIQRLRARIRSLR